MNSLPSAFSTLLLLLVPFFLSACSTSKNAIPRGKGLLSADKSPPKGAKTWAVPGWEVGDRYEFSRGARIPLHYRVLVVGPEERLLLLEGKKHGEKESVLVLGPDLSDRGVWEWREGMGKGAPEKRYLPSDPAFHWPLWVGKTWSSQFMEISKDGVQPIRVIYRCEAREPIRTRAGTFDCLRVRRIARLEIPGRIYLDKVSLLWYSPKVGWWVRKLEDGIETELTDYQRQGERKGEPATEK